MKLVVPVRAGLAALSFAGVVAGCGSEKDPANEPQACPGAPIDVPQPTSLASASRAGACEGATALVQWGDRAQGAACTAATQCQPTCCQCGAKDQSALISWCNHGRCATPNEVCCALAGTPLKSCG